MALGKAEGVSPLEAETAVNKFWVNNYTALIDAVKDRLGEEEGRKLAYEAYHKAVYRSCAPGWIDMRALQPNALDYTEWLITDLAQAYDLEVVEMTPDSCRLRITSCPWATLFRERDRADTGILFCEVDYDMVKDFNELTGASIAFERTKVLMKGDDHCNHHIFVKEE
jgi:hypothetical protein